MAWQELEKAYTTKGLVLALGAGVSVGSGLPTWLELLRRIGLSCLGPNGKDLVDELRQAGFGYPAIVGMLKTQCPKGVDFTAVVRENLYSDFPKELRGINKRDWGTLIDFIQKNNPTLRTVAALCALPNGSPTQFKRNPRIHAIINFNIDSVLRAYIHARHPQNLSPLLRTVERPSKDRHPDKINYYCMHGLLRFDAKAGQPDKEASDKLVLSEHEYFDFFNSPTSLFNYTFLYMLREYSCLFIGLSMQDDNIRRLLHYSAKELLNAYREEGEIGAYGKAMANKRHFAILRRSESGNIDGLVEDSLAELGANVLWIERYDEIPTRLGHMYSSTGDLWGSVF